VNAAIGSRYLVPFSSMDSIRSLQQGEPDDSGRRKFIESIRR